MAKRKPEIKMRSYGIYSKWNSKSKQLPQFLEPSTKVPARIGIEFGFILNIKGAKNQELDYCIDHPGILDSEGNRRPPFDGSVFVKTNDWNFYLGDTIWEPIDDKLGIWRMYAELDGKVIADKSFDLIADGP